MIAGLNLVGFVATALTKSHKVTDLTVRLAALACSGLRLLRPANLPVQGTSAFIGSAWFTHSVACKAMGVGLLAPSKSLLLTCLVTAWGARLAGYLFYRVLAVGKDGERYSFV